MIKEKLSLEAALFKVHSVRSVVHPNSGFWRQLRDLESVLRLQGVQLQPPPDAATRTAMATATAGSGEARPNGTDFDSLLASLDRGLDGVKSGAFATHFL